MAWTLQDSGEADISHHCTILSNMGTDITIHISPDLSDTAKSNVLFFFGEEVKGLWGGGGGGGGAVCDRMVP